MCGEEFEDAIMGRDIAYMGAVVLTVKNHFKPEGCAIGIQDIMFTIVVMGRMGLPILLDFAKWRNRLCTNLTEFQKNF